MDQHLSILKTGVWIPLYAIIVVVDDSALDGSVFSDVHIT